MLSKFKSRVIATECNVSKSNGKAYFYATVMDGVSPVKAQFDPDKVKITDLEKVLFQEKDIELEVTVGKWTKVNLLSVQ